MFIQRNIGLELFGVSSGVLRFNSRVVADEVRFNVVGDHLNLVGQMGCLLLLHLLIEMILQLWIAFHLFRDRLVLHAYRFHCEHAFSLRDMNLIEVGHSCILMSLIGCLRQLIDELNLLFLRLQVDPQSSDVIRCRERVNFLLNDGMLSLRHVGKS